MKKIIFILTISIFFACSEDSNTSFNENERSSNASTLRGGGPCPPGTNGSLSYEFNTIRLHRASRACERGFGICSDGFWVVNCEDENGFLVAQSPLGMSSGKTQTKAFIHPENHTINLYFPREITEADGFEMSDFDSFGVDEDWQISKDLTVRRGEYPVSSTSNGLIKIVLITY